MTLLSELPFKGLQAGMKFSHPHYGEQVILDLGRNSFGPIIKFHNCEIYSGKMPELLEDEEDIFQILAKSTFPSGADKWVYLGMVTPEFLATHGWQWFEVSCPHCGAIHHLLSSTTPSGGRQCITCGMIHNRSPQFCSSPLQDG